MVGWLRNPSFSAHPRMNNLHSFDTYVVLSITIKDPVRYRQYMEGVKPLILAAGGKYLCRGGETRVYEGAFEPQRVVLFEWPSLAAHEAFLNSDAYQPLKAIRLESADTIMFAVAGVETPIA